MTTLHIEATEQEAQALLQIMHRACLHSGMDVIDAVSVWRNKIMEASMRAKMAMGKNGKGVEHSAQENAELSPQ